MPWRNRCTDAPAAPSAGRLPVRESAVRVRRHHRRHGHDRHTATTIHRKPATRARGGPLTVLRRGRSLLVRAFAGAMAVGLVGCSSTVAGAARKAPGPANAEGVDVALLDTGSYPVAPNHPYGTAGPTRGGIFEA